MDEPIPRANWTTEPVTFSNGESVPFQRYALQEFVEHLDALEWLFENPDKARNRIREIQEARLLKFVERKDLGRVRDDLNRAFYKTLSELRRHQGWRKATREITVNPTNSDTHEEEQSPISEASPTPPLWNPYP